MIPAEPPTSPRLDRLPSRVSHWLPLSGLAEGSTARLRASHLEDSDRDLLTGLGLIPDRPLLVCKTGSPCIVEVRGVRVGLSTAIAERLLVEPVDLPLVEPSAGG
jgi:Fe2+ transport system protein FeoA